MDPEELEAGLEALHPASFQWALNCCAGDRQEAEDVLQSVYLKILDGRARFGGRSSLKTWLFAVIRRSARSRRRRQRLRRVLFERWSSREPRSPQSPAPEERLDRSRSAESLRRRLAGLSTRQRQVLELVFFHGLTVRESADVLGVTPGSASVHYHRAKRELARGLEAEP